MMLNGFARCHIPSGDSQGTLNSSFIQKQLNDCTPRAKEASMKAKVNAACISLIRKDFDGLRYFEPCNFHVLATSQFRLRGV